MTYTFDQIERALDAGELMMKCPCGDYVRARRRDHTAKTQSGRIIPVFMENQVEASIGRRDELAGFQGFKIEPASQSAAA